MPKMTYASIRCYVVFLLVVIVNNIPAIALLSSKSTHDVHRNRKHIYQSISILNSVASTDSSSSEQTIIEKQASEDTLQHHKLHRLLTSYTLHWENLLQREHSETVLELQQRRKSYTRQQLEASGLAIFNAVASPETELYGEKIVRISLQQVSLIGKNKNRDTNLREKFKRGDALLLTPLTSFRGKDITPREGLVMDVGSDFITLGVGPAWPVGLMEMRKHFEGYQVRLDRKVRVINMKSLSNVPLKVQRLALDKLRKGQAGSIADLFVQLYYNEISPSIAKEVPSHFDEEDLEQQIIWAMKDALSKTSFEPNPLQKEAIIWALGRQIALLRGPPGTGKTRCASLLISTALKMNIKQSEEEEVQRSPRVLAVTHSNGAADVLLQALLEMGVPAVRGGRPASVAPSVQHRTIAALSEQVPEVVRLRQQAGDASVDSQTRKLSIFEAIKCMNEAQLTIAKTAPVVVASCIGAQQMMSYSGEDEESSPFDIVVLDEAAQTTEPALVCALAASKARQLILFGDTMQLPPTVTTQDVELRKTIGVSPMERLLNNGIDEFVLKEQYRMPQALLHHPNKYFYKGVVKVAASVDKTGVAAPRGFPWSSPNNDPLAFLEVGGNNEIQHNFGGRSNPAEVDIIINIIGKVITAGDISAEDIAVITPYNKQVQLIREGLSTARRDNASTISDVKVGTVDSYQGQETDLVIFSGVRSNQMKELGFLRDERRLNVAITRAKKGLIVVGDPLVLRTCKHWSALIDSCSDRGCVLTQKEYYNHIQPVVAEGTQEDERERRLSSLEFDNDDLLMGLFDD